LFYGTFYYPKSRILIGSILHYKSLPSLL